MEATIVTIKGVDGNPIDVKMVSSAYTTLFFREMFKKDLTKYMAVAEKEQEYTFLYELAYTMAKEAVLDTPEEKTFPSIRKWTRQFDGADFLAKMGDILQVWRSGEETTVESKNK